MAVASEFLTFLFTDIEGSTALWERHPAEMEGVLARHDELLRAAVEAQRRPVVKSTGDGLHAVFRSPRDGVRAALDGQRAIADAEWPDAIDLRVRMGVHAGEAAERDGDWFGTEVNRAAACDVRRARRASGVHADRRGARAATDFDARRPRRAPPARPPEHRAPLPGRDPGRACRASTTAFARRSPDEPALRASSFIGRDRELADVIARLHESRLVSIVGRRRRRQDTPGAPGRRAPCCPTTPTECGCASSRRSTIPPTSTTPSRRR